MRSLRRDENGVAVYFIYGIVILVISGMVWYVGNQLLFGPQGIGTYYENTTPDDQKPTANVYKWVWNVWPIVVIIGAALYTILAAMIKEPYSY